MPLLDQPLGRVLAVVALLALSWLVLTLARRRDGVFRAVATPTASSPTATGPTAQPAAPTTPGAGTPAPPAVSTAPTVPAVPSVPSVPSADAVTASDVVTAGDLGRPLGATATLLQLSSPGCASCPQVRRVLAALVADRPDVAHVEVDASARPDLTRRLRVLRTPTVLILGPEGEVLARTSGRLDPETAARALDEHTRALEVARA